jgi:protein O-GlcNAc transferase
MTAEEHFRRAVQAYQAGNLAVVEEACRAVLTEAPNHFDALHLWGVVRSGLGDDDEAIKLIQRAVRINPTSANALVNLGHALIRTGRTSEALQAFDSAIRLKPNEAGLHFTRANLLCELDRLEEALADFGKTLELAPGATEAHDGCGQTLLALGRLPEALEHFNSAVAIAPDHLDALCHRAIAYREIGDPEAALADCNRILALNSNIAEAYYYRSCALNDLGRLEDALADCDKALEIRPDYVMAIGWRFHLAAIFCDWRGRLDQEKRLCAFRTKVRDINSYPLLYALDDPQLHLDFAQSLAESPALPLPKRSASSHEKLRIAYLSTDFYDHPVANQVVEMLEQHDHSRFEIHGLCTNPSPPNAEVRERIRQACDDFDAAGTLTDFDIAKMLAVRQIDIAVDLDGYSDKSRIWIFAHRPAPVAVTYLGYPGTTGAKYLDYLLADSHVIPPGNEKYYSEKIARLPDCFMPIDTRNWIAPATPSRREAGLPETGFVFCAFNNGFKMTPDIFNIWMNLLRKTEGSLLWLNVRNPTAQDNLRHEAFAREVAPERLVFAPRTATRGENFARLPLADLYLDTFPYGAHATASDFLRMGVPIVTCAGKCFASRVAASMLTVAGMPEMVAADFAAYETKALELAHTPVRLATIRAKAKNARNTALFDMRELSRNVETAYRTMWERHLNGLPPETFCVGETQ